MMLMSDSLENSYFDVFSLKPKVGPPSSELMAAGMAARVMKFMWKPFGSLTPHGRTSFFGKRVVFSLSMGRCGGYELILPSTARNFRTRISTFFVRELGRNTVVTVSYVGTAFMV